MGFVQLVQLRFHGCESLLRSAAGVLARGAAGVARATLGVAGAAAGVARGAARVARRNALLHCKLAFEFILLVAGVVLFQTTEGNSDAEEIGLDQNSQQQRSYLEQHVGVCG